MKTKKLFKAAVLALAFAVVLSFAGIGGGSGMKMEKAVNNGPLDPYIAGFFDVPEGIVTQERAMIENAINIYHVQNGLNHNLAFEQTNDAAKIYENIRYYANHGMEIAYLMSHRAEVFVPVMQEFPDVTFFVIITGYNSESVALAVDAYGMPNVYIDYIDNAAFGIQMVQEYVLTLQNWDEVLVFGFAASLETQAAVQELYNQGVNNVILFNIDRQRMNDIEIYEYIERLLVSDSLYRGANILVIDDRTTVMMELAFAHHGYAFESDFEQSMCYMPVFQNVAPYLGWNHFLYNIVYNNLGVLVFQQTDNFFTGVQNNNLNPVMMGYTKI